MAEQTVEGFSNYATFGVAVTLDNDRKTRTRVLEQVDYIRKVAHMLPNVRDNIWTREEAIRFTLADYLKHYTEELCEAGIRSSAPSLMASQMVQAGLAEVNWHELADHELAE